MFGQCLISAVIKQFKSKYIAFKFTTVCIDHRNKNEI